MPVIGFCDVRDKPYGSEAITLFDVSQKFKSDKTLSMKELREYSKSLGLFSSGKRGTQPKICDPVYKCLRYEGQR